MVKKRVDPAIADPDETPQLELQRRFGANFLAVREAGGWSQPEIAKRSGVDQADISKIEKGKKNLSLRLMRRLADAVDHDVSVLLTARVRSRKGK